MFIGTPLLKDFVLPRRQAHLQQRNLRPQMMCAANLSISCPLLTNHWLAEREEKKDILRIKRIRNHCCLTNGMYSGNVPEKDVG